MRSNFSAIATTCIPVSALAAPACLSGSTPILSCSFSHSAKAVVACHDGLVATYVYRKTGKAPDLALSAPMVSLSYVPWRGIGSATTAPAFTNSPVRPTTDPRMAYLTHTYEGPDDMPAHIKAALLPTSLSIQVHSGELALGPWQGIYLFEHRNAPQKREVVAQLT